MTDGPPSLSLTTVAQGVVLAVAVPWVGSVVGSFTGDKGTMAGAVVGAVLSAVLGWVFLRFVWHARRLPWQRARERTRPWHVAVAAPVLGVSAFGVWAVTATGAEAVVLHKSLAASVGAAKGSGTTLGSLGGGWAARPSPSRLAPSAATSGATIPATVGPSVEVPTITSTPTIPATPTPPPTSGVPAFTSPPAPAPATAAPSTGGPALPASIPATPATQGAQGAQP